MSDFKKTMTRIGLFGCLAVAAAALVVPAIGIGQTVAPTLNLPVIPLFLGQTTKPNVIMAIDNSGSTDYETSVTATNGQPFWNPGVSPCNTAAVSPGFSGCGASAGSDAVAATSTLNVNPRNSTNFYQFAYLFPNGTTTASGGRVYPDGIGSTANNNAVAPIPAYAWARSRDWNKSYFDPTRSYAPWEKYDRSSYGNQTAAAAQYDPSKTATATVNLTALIADTATVAISTSCESTPVTSASGTANWGFRVFTGMTLPANTCLLARKTSCTGSGTGTGGCQSQNPAAPTNGQCFNTGSTNVYCTQSAWVQLGTTTGVASSITVAASGSAANYAYTGDTHSAVLNNTTQFIRYYPATFWLAHGTPSPYASFNTANRLTGTDPAGGAMDGYEIKSSNFSNAAEYTTAIQNFANWFSYYRKRILALKNGIGASFNNLATPLRLANFPIGTTSGSLTMLDSSVSTQMAAFYSAVYGLSANGGTPDREAIRYIGAQYRRTDTSAPINSVCQRNFGILFTDGYADPLNTPNPTPPYSTTGAGNYDGASTGPGVAYGAGSAPYTDSVAYTMGDETLYDYVGPLRNDGTYLNASAVPLDPQCSVAHAASLDCNPKLHMVFYGVILNTLGYAYDGSANANANAYVTTPAWPANSTALNSQSPAQVDDLWHATVNGRGKLLNAQSPADISNQLASVLQEITAQTGSGSAVALNTTSISSNSAIYAASFYNQDWSGDLRRLGLSSAGAINATADWSAQALLDTQTAGNYSATARKILTFNPTAYEGRTFRWTDLDARQQALLGTNPGTGVADSSANGMLRLDYIRGSHAQEPSASNPRFRSRAHVLGDIVDSSPFYVGAPGFSYNDSTYTTFRTTYAARTPMVYVGGNDGMLHGFEADAGQTNSGKELIAYIPSKAYGSINGTTCLGLSNCNPELAALTNSNYVHQFIVNGSPTVGDAKLTSGGWKSVLVSGMGSGGQGVFALDVTNPSSFSEPAAGARSSTVMWEFTDADDPDLGFTYSQPSIVKMANGKWAAIVGNGYNNTSTLGGAEAAATTSTTNAGKAALFILFLDGPSCPTCVAGSRWVRGTDYVKILAGATQLTVANGLAAPAAVDVNQDETIDYIYAGDRLGRLWRFNVTSTSPSNWQAAYGGTASGGGAPIFTATDTTGGVQPITERPEVGYNATIVSPNSCCTSSAHPELVVYFGTGSFIEQATDTATTGQKTQSFYAIYDHFDDVVTPSRTAPVTTVTRDVNNSAATTYNLLRQSITNKVAVTTGGGAATAAGACTDTSNCFRITTNNALASGNQGWYVDLINTGAAVPANAGERQVTTPILRNGRIVFTTLIPSANICSGGGSGWLMELNARTGARLPTSPLDVNNNGVIDSAASGLDNLVLTAGNPGVGVSGARSTVGILSSPAILRIDDGSERKFIGGSKGVVDNRLESAAGRSGRIVWREVTP